MVASPVLFRPCNLPGRQANSPAAARGYCVSGRYPAALALASHLEKQPHDGSLSHTTSRLRPTPLALNLIPPQPQRWHHGAPAARHPIGV